jgi:hypothetical protein
MYKDLVRKHQVKKPSEKRKLEEMIILKCISKEQDEEAWNGLIPLRI